MKEIKGNFNNNLSNQNEDAEPGGTPATRVIDLVSPYTEFFTDEMGKGYAAINYPDHKEIYPIDSIYFKRFCVNEFYEAERKPIKGEHLSQALEVFETKAQFEGKTIKLGKRVASYNGNFYYDLANDDWKVIKISKRECIVDDNPPVLFTRNNNMKSQVLPDFTSDAKELLSQLDRHFRFIKREDKILFAPYLVSCLIPDISHPILVLSGEKGASKSTSMRMIKSIIDPSRCDLLTLPISIQNMAISFSNNYMPAYDNLQSISPEKSDILCMASSGGSFSTRTLYTNSEETIFTFKRPIMLNGINVVATRPDLLDRAIILELERIKETERKTEEVIWKKFNEDLPSIQGSCFNALSIAMNTVTSVNLEKLGRMADFCVWSYAIAEAIGINGEEFVDSYIMNQERANEEALESNPLAAAILIFMKDRANWSGSVANLLERLKEIANEHSINAHDPIFPKASHVLSKRLKEVKSNLENAGITYTISHAGDYKKIVIVNRHS